MRGAYWPLRGGSERRPSITLPRRSLATSAALLRRPSRASPRCALRFSTASLCKSRGSVRLRPARQMKTRLLRPLPGEKGLNRLRSRCEWVGVVGFEGNLHGRVGRARSCRLSRPCYATRTPAFNKVRAYAERRPEPRSHVPCWAAAHQTRRGC